MVALEEAVCHLQLQAHRWAGPEVVEVVLPAVVVPLLMAAALVPTQSGRLEVQTQAVAAVAVAMVATAVQALSSSRYLTHIVRHSLAVLPTLYRLQAQT
jgi:hypothetical protein